MNARGDLNYSIGLAKEIAGDLAGYIEPAGLPSLEPIEAVSDSELPLADTLLREYDKRIIDQDLRAATRSRFSTGHYADAVEAAVKALNACVRMRTGRTEDGDGLMTIAFSSNDPLLRINKGRSKSDESAQRGHMFLCQGVVGAWRNPRAHSNMADTPDRSLVMLATINELIEVTKAATRTRTRKKP